MHLAYYKQVVSQMKAPLIDAYDLPNVPLWYIRFCIGRYRSTNFHEPLLPKTFLKAYTYYKTFLTILDTTSNSC